MTEAAPFRIMSVPQWPSIDRLAWERAEQTIEGPFAQLGGGREVSPFTIIARRQAYGLWLGYLRDTGQLDETEMPSARFTPERLDGFIASMRQRGNRPGTIVPRIYNLVGAMKMIEPMGDHGWIARPQGTTIERFFDIVPLERPVHHSAVLLDWAFEIFEKGLAHPSAWSRQNLVRDAAIISVLVMPAPRRGALAKFRLGTNLQRREDGWWLDQEAGITKTGTEEWSPLHPMVTPILDRYVAVERVELLQGRLADHMWIAHGGGKMAVGTVGGTIFKHSANAFDRSFGTHAARRSLMTTVAIDGYDSPLDATVLLGHTTPSRNIKSYNKAQAFAAAERNQERMRRVLQRAERAVRSEK